MGIDLVFLVFAHPAGDSTGYVPIIINNLKVTVNPIKYIGSTVDNIPSISGGSTSDVRAIKAQTDKLQFTTDNDVKSTLDGEEVTTDTASRDASKADVSRLDVNVSSRLATSGYTAPPPDNTSDITAIKAKTDSLNFTGDDVKATLDGEEVTTDDASRTCLLYTSPSPRD